jgi:beta-lactam-binding protein with PASTA domain
MNGMKRNIKLLLIIMIPLLTFSACIFSTTPTAGPVSLIWGQNQTFMVNGMGTYQWTLDSSPVGTGATYTFKSTEYAPRTYQLHLESTYVSAFGTTHGDRDWTITVTSAPAIVPTASGCADVTGVGLVCDTVLNCSNTVPKGNVVTQAPVAGSSVPAGSTVHLTLSSGPCGPHEVKVPAATSCASVEAAGFVCSTTTSCSNEVPAGVVLYQSPAAGTMAMSGTMISLVLSSGPCTAEVEVPNATSCADITDAGFICSHIYECSMTVPVEGVINQSPTPGMMRMLGSTVELTLSSGICKMQVPDVTTCEGIVEAGLKCNLVTICDNAHPTPGEFISLSPVAGTPIAPGATVTLSQSIGPCTVVVPDADTCEEIVSLSGGWLTCSTTSECNDGVPAGQKISQNPAPGTEVATGTAVELVISTGKCPVMLPTPTNVSATDVVLTSQTDPTLNHNLNDRVTITWTGVTGAEYYKVYRADSAISTYTYIGRTVGTETTYNDMQSAQTMPTLVIPPMPDMPMGEGKQAENTAALTAYELVVRPIVQQFKDFKFYKVKASTTDPAFLDSAFSNYDEGRMDYTLDEFYTVSKGVLMGIPLARLMIVSDPQGLGTNAWWDDNCGDGRMHFTISISGTSGLITLTITNFVESACYNLLNNTIDCSPSKRKMMTVNTTTAISGTVSASMNGTLTGAVAITNNYAGKYNSISIPVVNGDIAPGTATIIYNGQTVAGHEFVF